MRTLLQWLFGPILKKLLGREFWRMWRGFGEDFGPIDGGYLLWEGHVDQVEVCVLRKENGGI